MDKRIRILVAEEDSSFLKMMEDSLKASGSQYHIQKVSSGGECLRLLQKEKFDILLLDHSLSDGEGLNWLRRFNELGIGIPTIFVTAKGDPRLAIEAMKEGVFDYINRSAECAKAFPFVVNRAIEGHGLMVEKVRLQKELIETKNFLESIVEKAGDAISVVDLEGKILYWNEGAEKIYGYMKEEVLGKKLSQFLHPRDEKLKAEEEKLMEKLMVRMKKGEVIPNVEVKRQTKDGKEIVTSMTISPLKDAEGRIVGASRIFYFLGKEKYENMTRIGAYIAPFPVIVGILALITDLERPHLFWKLFVTFRPSSVMSLGSWLLLFFSFFSFAHLYLWLPERLDYLKLIPAIRSSKFLSRFPGDNLTKLRGLVAGFGIPVSIGVGIYTGVLLGVLTARPFWNNPMLPMLFLISAMMTGSASICLVGSFTREFYGMSREQVKTCKFMIHSIDFTLMVFFVITLFLFILGLYVLPRSSNEAVHLIMGGEFTLLFWLLVVGLGILLPLTLEVYELIPHYIGHVELEKHRPWISGIIGASILIGGFVMRYVVIYAGQIAQAIS